MLRSYLVIALRTLRRQKGYAAINVGGLAVGIACCLLIGLFVRDELSYDRFHGKADRVYRVALELQAPSEPEKYFAVTAAPLAPMLLENYPDIEEAVRLTQAGMQVERGNRRFYETDALFADASFFELFSFPLREGDARTALAEPYSIVLTEAAARKYFGDGDPLGRTLRIENEQTFTVTGVLGPAPRLSHLPFDFLVSFETLASSGQDVTQWWWHEYYTYVLLREGANPKAVEVQIREATLPYSGETTDGSSFRQMHFLQPLTGIYLHSDLRGEIGPTGDPANISIFMVAALLILVVACVNFTNLATARALRRAREVGMRKVLGAQRRQLIGQFLGEALLTTLAAVLLALGLAELALPTFNAITGKSMALGLFRPGLLLPTLLALTVLVGVLAGSYPAFALSAFRPVEALRGHLRHGPSGARLRQGLVVFQFAISIFLIVGTLGIQRQLAYMRGQDLGFEKEQVVVLPFQNNPDVQRRYETAKDVLRAVPDVVSASVSSSIPGRPLSNVVSLPEGYTEARTMLTLITDYDFAATYGLEIAAGRYLSREVATDSAEAFVLNEAAVADIGWPSAEAAIGKAFDWGLGKRGRVVGVVKDFHFASLQQRVQPLVMHFQPQRFNYLAVRINPDDVPRTLAALEAAWQPFSANRPFAYFFLDDEFDQQYRAEQRTAAVVRLFTGLALAIACLGLLGLVAFTTQQRTKELGVRKVLGASVTSIVLLLTKDFVRLVLVAAVLAMPVAYLAMARWLEAFAYRITLGPGVFLLAGGLALAVALLTVSYHALRAATTDPVRALRYE